MTVVSVTGPGEVWVSVRTSALEVGLAAVVGVTFFMRLREVPISPRLTVSVAVGETVDVSFFGPMGVGRNRGDGLRVTSTGTVVT